MKIALILFLTVGFVGCSYTGLNLPLHVTEKKVTDGGTCSVVVKPVDQRDRDYQVFQTPYDLRYCQYEIGQEIK